MSLKYGLNTKKKAAPTPARKPIFDDDGDDDEPTAPNGAPAEEAAIEEISTFDSSNNITVPSQSSRKPKPTTSTGPIPPKKKPAQQESDIQDLSSAHNAQTHISAAASTDPSIFDYDAFHDAKSTVSQKQKELERQDAIERKPKYIGNLLDAAARRKQDQLVAREKLLQKERENEGDEFADKEKFVTGAYKAQQAEAHRLEEEEAKRKADEEERKRRLGVGAGGGMQGFYRGMMDQREEQHRQAVEAAERVEKGGPAKDGEAGGKERTDAELAEEAKWKGVNVHVNEEGQITDKRELLSAGLNIGGGSGNKASSGQGADHLRVSNRAGQTSAFAGRNEANKQAQRERQSQMLEEQLAARQKRAREEEEEERKKLEEKAKSQKTAGDVSDAKARYLARKAAKERGEG